MKNFLIISALAGILSLSSKTSNAQVSLSLNIGTQPTWVPAGYQDVNYYYLPEVQSYYYVPQRQFVYLSGNRWTRSRYLPARYRGYDLHHGRKVVVYGNSPYRNYNSHRAMYTHHVNYVHSSYGGRGPANYRNNGHYRSYNQYSGHGKGHGPAKHGGGHGRGRH